MKQIIRLATLPVVLLVFLSYISASGKASVDVIYSFNINDKSINVNEINRKQWEDANAYHLTIGSEDPIPEILVAEVYAVHSDDGIFLRLEITDNITHKLDKVRVLFDLPYGINDDLEADCGIVAERQGIGYWGLITKGDINWDEISLDSLKVSELGTKPWIVQFYFPFKDNPCKEMDIPKPNDRIGIFFQLMDQDHDTNNNKWPYDSGNSDDPATWGDYIFDPEHISPVLTIEDVGNVYTSDRRMISLDTLNSFEIVVENKEPNAILDAENVRANLYLTPRGFGAAPWHRIDQEDILASDCDPGQTWLSKGVTRTEVCGNGEPWPDMSDKSVDLENLKVNYTIIDGVERKENSASFIVSADLKKPLGKRVLQWQLTNSQKDKYENVFQQISKFQHQCMLAEILYETDNGTASHTKQVNMDFEDLTGGTTQTFQFHVGSAQFLQYNPEVGKEMFMRMVDKNMDTQLGWRYELENVDQIDEGLYVVPLQGNSSVAVQLHLTAPPADRFGLTLKENLMIPAQAGGRTKYIAAPSGQAPIHVRVKAGTRLLVTNYSFDDQDFQSVDLDGVADLLPINGVRGVPYVDWEGYVNQTGANPGNLLVPTAPPGTLVGSFDQFRTGFTIGQGVQVVVPPKAGYLSLAINDIVGRFNDNGGTGFRVKVVQQNTTPFPGVQPSLRPGQLQIVPISDVMPTLCVSGYEKLNEKLIIRGEQHDQYRYIGNVCWGIVNVYPPNRSPIPDRGDLIREIDPIIKPWFCQLFPRSPLCFD